MAIFWFPMLKEGNLELILPDRVLVHCPLRLVGFTLYGLDTPEIKEAIDFPVRPAL